MGRLFVGSFFFLRMSPTTEAVESEKEERKPNPKHARPPPKKPTRKQIKKAKQQANVPDIKAKTLFIVTAFIGEKGYKKGTQQLINANIPDATSEIGSASVP